MVLERNCLFRPKGPAVQIAKAIAPDITHIFSVRTQPQRGFTTKPGVAVTKAHSRKNRTISCEPQRATPLSIYRSVFAGFLEVPSPPGKGEKVADRPDEGAFEQGSVPEKPPHPTLSPKSFAASRLCNSSVQSRKRFGGEGTKLGHATHNAQLQKPQATA